MGFLVDQTRSESRPDFRMLHANAHETLAWPFVHLRSVPIACNAGTITTSRNAHPVCSTGQSAHSLSALSQCSVIIRDSQQLTVSVSAWLFEAGEGQRTWVLDSGGSNRADSVYQHVERGGTPQPRTFQRRSHAVPVELRYSSTGRQRILYSCRYTASGVSIPDVRQSASHPFARRPALSRLLCDRKLQRGKSCV